MPAPSAQTARRAGALAVVGAEPLGAGDVALEAELREQPACRVEVLGGASGLALRARELGQSELGAPGVEARSNRLEGPQRLAQPALALAVVAPSSGDVAERPLG